MSETKRWMRNFVHLFKARGGLHMAQGAVGALVTDLLVPDSWGRELTLVIDGAGAGLLVFLAGFVRVMGHTKPRR